MVRRSASVPLRGRYGRRTAPWWTPGDLEAAINRSRVIGADPDVNPQCITLIGRPWSAPPPYPPHYYEFVQKHNVRASRSGQPVSLKAPPPKPPLWLHQA